MSSTSNLNVLEQSFSSAIEKEKTSYGDERPKSVIGFYPTKSKYTSMSIISNYYVQFDGKIYFVFVLSVNFFLDSWKKPWI